MNKKKILGIWFFGVSGSGKTYLSKILKKKIKNSLLIDGDIVRKYISYDLGYSLRDREKQIRRVFGLGKIIALSGNFPIMSTVYFNKELLKLCKKENFCAVHLIRANKKLIKKNNPTYKNKKNIVGVDIAYDKFKSETLLNDDTDYYWKKAQFLNFLT